MRLRAGSVMWCAVLCVAMAAAGAMAVPADMGEDAAVARAEMKPAAAAASPAQHRRGGVEGPPHSPVAEAGGAGGDPLPGGGAAVPGGAGGPPRGGPRRDPGFVHAVAAALSVIVVSELGDKTFFIAAIMAMRYNRLTVLAGAMVALTLMHCLSVLFGFATTVVPRLYTYYVSTALFALFGARMLRDGLRMGPDEGHDEIEEVQAQIKRRDKEMEQAKPGDVEVGGPAPPAGGGVGGGRWGRWGGWGATLGRLVSPVLLQAFTLTLIAEWGDRSQITTIVLAARENPLGVAVGGCVGHGLCTGLAVIGGRMIAQRISVRTVTIVGGVVFLMFAISSLFMSPDS